MAGKSSRFFNAGYKLPKYMLPLKSNSNVFREAIKSFENYFKTDVFFFITREEPGVFDFVKKECDFLGINNFKIVSIDFNTRGQADTIKIGLDKITKDEDEEIYIFNIDSVRLDFKKPKTYFLEKTFGYLEVFKGEGDHWSFIEPKCESIVKKTTEKIRISNLCSNGLYYFKSISLFLETFKEFEKINNYKELFVAPMYNILIQKEKLVKYLLVNEKDTLFSGTPFEYELLRKIF